MTACQDFRMGLGAYVLGALPDEEAARVRAHLERCPKCRAEHNELAGVPSFLGRISEEEAAKGPPQAGGELLDRLLSESSADGRTARIRSRLPRLLAAAAVVLAVFTAGGVWLLAQPDGTPEDSGRPGFTAVSATDPDTNVSATVRYRAHHTGTELLLKLEGVAAGERCKVIAVGVDGEEQVGSTWRVPPPDEEEGSVWGWLAFRPDEVRTFEIETLDGRRLVTVGGPVPQ